MFSTLPRTPILNASTGMSSSSERAWSATQSASIASIASTPIVSCTVSAVITDSGWQPRLERVSRSACTPAPPDGSDAAKARTIGGKAGSESWRIGSVVAFEDGAHGARIATLRFYSMTSVCRFARGLETVRERPSDEEIHVPDLRLDLRRGAGLARGRHSAGNALGGRAA